MDANVLLAALVFGSLGLSYTIYGRRQNNKIVFYSGVALLVLPYLVANLWALIGISIALLGLPFLLR